MDKEAVLEVITRFRQALTQHIHVKKIILFGSYARNDWHKGSDIDVIVLSDDFASKSYWEQIDIFVDAIKQVFAPIEAVGMTPDEWKKGDRLIAQYARKDGEVVYDEAA